MEHALNRLRDNATKCRDLASDAITPAARAVLTGMAEDYEQSLFRLEADVRGHPLRRPAFKWPLA